jgi:hypothetical protein
MRKRAVTICLGICGLLFAGTAVAQEMGPEPSETPAASPAPEETQTPVEAGAWEGKGFLSTTPRDADNRPNPAGLPPAARPKAEKQPEKDEDALSFNFLFYIIQKFKMSDIKNN